MLLNTVPEWWIGLLLLIILGGYLGWVPLGGMYDIGDGSLGGSAGALGAACLVASISGWIGFSRILRFEMLEVMNQDYVRTAKAKGLSQQVVVVASCFAQRHDALCHRFEWHLPVNPLRLAAL